MEERKGEEKERTKRSAPEGRPISREYQVGEQQEKGEKEKEKEAKS